MAGTSNRLQLPLLEAGQAQKELTHNEALALIDATLSGEVLAMNVTAPPASPTAGQCWLVGATPAGPWMGKADHIAVWTDGGWRFVPPRAGMLLWVHAAALYARYTGAAWSLGSLPVSQLEIGGLPILTVRQGAIAAPGGGATVDVEGRAAIANILAALRTHGLITA